MKESKEEIKNEVIKKIRNIEFICIIIWIGAALLFNFAGISNDNINVALAAIVCLSAITWLVVRVKRYNIQRKY